MTRCRGRAHTVKRVKSAWLRSAVAMMHYLRIVNARGRQKRHGHDHEDRFSGLAVVSVWRNQEVLVNYNLTCRRPEPLF
jgi:hypothetical protein